jgi:hypothetical protein
MSVALGIVLCAVLAFETGLILFCWGGFALSEMIMVATVMTFAPGMISFCLVGASATGPLGVGWRLDPVGSRPGPPLFRGEAAAVPPAILCIAAAAGMVFARIALMMVLRSGHRHRKTDGGCHVGKQSEAGGEPWLK